MFSDIFTPVIVRPPFFEERNKRYNVNLMSYTLFSIKYALYAICIMKIFRYFWCVINDTSIVLFKINNFRCVLCLFLELVTITGNKIFHGSFNLLFKYFVYIGNT